MKQGTGALISLAVTVALGGFLIYTLMQQKQYEKPAPSQENQSRIILRDTQMQSINTITVSNAKGAYTLVNLGNGLALKDREAIPYQKEKLNQLAQAASHVTAKQLVTHHTAKECGLDLPLVTVTADYIDKPALTLSIGKETSNGVYIQADEKLYLADSKEMAPFLWSEKDLVSSYLIPQKAKKTSVNSIVLSGEVRPQPIVLEAIPPKGAEETLRYKMTAPQQTLINGEDVLSWATPALGLYADKVVHLNPDSQDMTAYGFDKPFSILDITLGEESFSLISTSVQEGKCYVMRQGVPVVYQVDAGKLPWLTLQVQTLTKALFDPKPVEKVEKIMVSTPVSSWTYQLKQEETGFSVTVNQQPLSPNQFQSFYKQLSSVIEPEEYVGSLNIGEAPLLNIQILYTEELKPDKISFLPGPEEGTVYLQYNGKTSYTARKSIIDVITDACYATVHQDDPEE